MEVRSKGWAALLHWLNLALIASVVLYAFGRAIWSESLGLGDAGSSSSQVLDLLAFAVLCGLATFATIEVLKRVFDLRGRFQYARTRDWIEGRERERALLEARREVERRLEEREEKGWRPEEFGEEESAFHDLEDAMSLGKGRDARRLFNLPTEQLAAQLGAAADLALMSRFRYPRLIAAFAGQFGSGPDLNADLDDGEAFRDLAQRVRVGVDQLQITLGEDWRRLVQGAALWLAGLYGIAFAYAGDIGSAAHPRYVLMALILGGVFAWVARDVTRVIENARR